MLEMLEPGDGCLPGKTAGLTGREEGGEGGQSGRKEEERGEVLELSQPFGALLIP